MLLLVLLTILAAAGVLVGAVLTGHPQWAWITVVLSVVGALLLVVSRGRGRGAERAAAEPDAASEPAPATAEGSPSGEAGESEPSTARAADSPDEGEQPEEDTDAADALVVSELETTVVVLDERPRYHLSECDRLGDHEVIPLPVREARELGFTPCGGCLPDATLAARQRTPADG